MKEKKLFDTEIEKARQLDLLTYLERYDPNELVRITEGRYTTRTHGSLKIDHGKWYWWARGIGGRSALDYLVSVQGLDFMSAVKHILELECVPCTADDKTLKMQRAAGKRPSFVLPNRAKNNQRVISYLVHRGIDKEIFDYFIEKELIYESQPYHNAVFVGKDDKGNAAYAMLRSIGKQRFVGEAAGSRKEYAFSFFSEGKADTVHIFESAIDLLSYATLMKMKGKEWKETDMVSLGGCAVSTDIGLLDDRLKRIEKRRNIKTVILHLDNDEAGRICSEKLMRKLAKDYEVIDRPPPQGKDVNDYLLLLMKQREAK